MIEVQVIIPVHNASSTIVETVQSAMHQQCSSRSSLPPPNNEDKQNSKKNNDTKQPMFEISAIHVCCFDDGSTDDSWDLLLQLLKQTQQNNSNAVDEPNRCIPATLHIERHNPSRGAGVARNRAVAMYSSSSSNPATVLLLCWLDSDDIMRPTRVYEQVAYFMTLHEEQQHHMLLGCQFERDPPDATWHYTNWANHQLTDERLLLEQFREVTVIQPTWMMLKSRFLELGGYIEPPLLSEDTMPQHPLVDPTHDTAATLRLAEDLRFFHHHLQHAGQLKLLRSKPLVIYRHVPGMSQSSQTPRKLLLRIRVLAFSRAILQQSWNPTPPPPGNPHNHFCIWGAGRDGKDFYKALSPEWQARVYCFADVDDKKIIQVQHYGPLKIPIVHFALLAKDVETRNQLHQAWCQEEEPVGRIEKGRSESTTTIKTATSSTEPPPMKKQRLSYLTNSKLDMTLLSQIPVVVCVAMYRTNGALERNVQSIGRTEGKNLWFFH